MSRVGPSSPSPLPAAVAGGVEIHTCTRGVRGQQAAGRCVTVKTVKLTLAQAKVFISTKLFFHWALSSSVIKILKAFIYLFAFYLPFSCSIEEKTGPNTKLKTYLCVSASAS